MRKQIRLIDNTSVKDQVNLENDIDLEEIIYHKKKNSLAKGQLECINPLTGEVLWTRSNKVIITGAEFIARALFELPGMYSILPSYNNVLNLDETQNSTVPGSTYKSCLFCVGMSGCGREASQVFEPDYKRIIDEKSIIPFQYRPQNADISTLLRDNVYAGRKTVTSSGGNFYAYYFKRFDSTPTLHQIYVDGTPIDPSNIYWDKTNLAVITKVTFNLFITNSDCRDYFYQTVGMNEARINELSICLGWLSSPSGHPVFQDIRPVTRVTFPNESLIDTRKTIMFRYSVYF